MPIQDAPLIGPLFKAANDAISKGILGGTPEELQDKRLLKLHKMKAEADAAMQEQEATRRKENFGRSLQAAEGANPGTVTGFFTANGMPINIGKTAPLDLANSFEMMQARNAALMRQQEAENAVRNKLLAAQTGHTEASTAAQQQETSQNKALFPGRVDAQNQALYRQRLMNQVDFENEGLDRETRRMLMEAELAQTFPAIAAKYGGAVTKVPGSVQESIVPIQKTVLDPKTGQQRVISTEEQVMRQHIPPYYAKVPTERKSLEITPSPAISALGAPPPLGAYGKSKKGKKKNVKKGYNSIIPQ